MDRRARYVARILIIGSVCYSTTVMFLYHTNRTKSGCDTENSITEKDRDRVKTSTSTDDITDRSYELLKKLVANIRPNEALSLTSSNDKEFRLEDEVPWLKRSTCKPAKDIAFLKIHKCASSTVQNMLMRYGSKHNLLFAMPADKHIFPLNVPFDASMVHSGADFHTEKSNIFTMHAIWNKKEISKILNDNAIYFTIVREPKEAFLSLYDYFAFETFYEMPVDKFVATHGIEMERFMGCLSYNIIACDMGAQPGDYINPKAIKLLTYQVNMDFDLVMIAERFEESLVLLKHLLCWSYEDMVVLNANTRLKKKDKLTAAVSDMLEERLKPDYYIYNYFYKKFDMLVKAFGEKRMEEELKELRRVMKSKIESCNIVHQKPSDADGPEQAGSSKVEYILTNSTDLFCRGLVKPEQAFVQQLKKNQAQMIAKSKENVEVIQN